MRIQKAIIILSFIQFSSLILMGCFPLGETIHSNDFTRPKEDISTARIKKGRGYYLRECGQCHPHIKPAERTRNEWRRILGRKKNKVSLTKDQFAKLKEYILSKSK